MNTAMNRLILILSLFTVCGTVLGQLAPSAEMKDDIRKLMVVTGTGNLAIQMMNQMLGPLKQAAPNVPEEFWTKFVAKMDADELIDLIVPVYAKYFTHEEIKQLLAFYETPLGKKMISSLPAVMQESMVAGQKWGQKIAQQIISELKAEGYQ